MATEHVPRSALCFTAGEFELGDNGDGAKTAPFKMVARSGQPVDHKFWGRIVHDVNGLRLSKQRIPIDYCHDDREIVGYANRFSADPGDDNVVHLGAAGALVPFKDSDRATEIIHKQKAGVPYQASIDFGGKDLELERVEKGQSVPVNGYQFSGPGVVVRQWSLRSIAVCPYGADPNTSTTFSGGNEIAVKFREPSMSDTKPQDTKLTVTESEQTPDDETKQPEAEAQEESTAVEAEAANDTAEAEVAQAEAVEAPPAADANAEQLSEGMRFLDSFGDRGGVWFAQGKSFAESQQLFIHELQQERDQLKAKLSALEGLGEETPVKFSTADKPKKTSAIRIRK
jgi:hypothetical protein